VPAVSGIFTTTVVGFLPEEVPAGTEASALICPVAATVVPSMSTPTWAPRVLFAGVPLRYRFGMSRVTIANLWLVDAAGRAKVRPVMGTRLCELVDCATVESAYSVSTCACRDPVKVSAKAATAASCAKIMRFPLIVICFVLSNIRPSPGECNPFPAFTFVSDTPERLASCFLFEVAQSEKCGVIEVRTQGALVPATTRCFSLTLSRSRDES